MSFTICAFNNAEWSRFGLAEYGDFTEQISERNMGEDSFCGYGQWFFVPDRPLPSNDLVIYFGSWGNDNSPGASLHTHAEIFDADDPEEIAEFHVRVHQWQSAPEFV